MTNLSKDELTALITGIIAQVMRGQAAALAQFIGLVEI